MESNVPEVAPSALRHAVHVADLRHACRHAVRFFELEEGMTMVIGPGEDGTLYEVGLVTRGDRLVAVHAMRARPKFTR